MVHAKGIRHYQPTNNIGQSLPFHVYFRKKMKKNRKKKDMGKGKHGARERNPSLSVDKGYWPILSLNNLLQTMSI